MRKFFSLFILLGFFFAAQAQKDSLILEGKYYESNVYFFNPSIQDSFSVYMLVVNEDTITEDLNSNAIEVDLEMWNLQPEADVRIIIYFDSLYPAFAVNPEALYSPTKFKFSKPRARKDVLSWRVYGDVSDYPIEVQQYRWNSWRVVAEVDPLDTTRNNMYSIPLKPHSGENMYRLKTTNLQDEAVYSKIERYRAPNNPEIFIKEYKVKLELEFSRETEFEIFDDKGIKVMEGKDRYVDISKLKDGEYWVNYDNKSEKIKKK